MSDARSRELCALLADLLAYPRGDLAALARRARGLAVGPAAAALERFAEAAEAEGAAGMQELYTATFDLRPACAPYLGVHLFGEDSPVRGPLLARLAELYAEAEFRPREELQDHVAEVLAFVAMAPPGPARDDLVEDGLVPALRKMAEALGQGANPYRALLDAARAVAEPLVAPAGTSGGRTPRPELVEGRTDAR
jgi:nitrate reductase delta subunit